MIDLDVFYRELGATQSLGADEQLVLAEQVRVMCAPEAATAVFQSLSTGEDKLDALFEVCRMQGGVLPFTTRSGQLAVRLISETADDETVQVLQRLRAVMTRFQVGIAE